MAKFNNLSQIAVTVPARRLLPPSERSPEGFSLSSCWGSGPRGCSFPCRCPKFCPGEPLPPGWYPSGQQERFHFRVLGKFGDVARHYNVPVAGVPHLFLKISHLAPQALAGHGIPLPEDLLPDLLVPKQLGFLRHHVLFGGGVSRLHAAISESPLPQRSMETTGSGRRRPQSPLFVRGLKGHHLDTLLRGLHGPFFVVFHQPCPLLFFWGLFYQTGWDDFDPPFLLQSPCKVEIPVRDRGWRRFTAWKKDKKMQANHPAGAVFCIPPGRSRSGRKAMFLYLHQKLLLGTAAADAETSVPEETSPHQRPATAGQRLP